MISKYKNSVNKPRKKRENEKWSLLRTELMFWESKGKKYLTIQTRNTEMVIGGVWGEPSRRPNVQIIGLAEREKVIEEIFLELKNILICRLKGYQIYSRVSGVKRGNTGLDTC